MTHGTLPTRNSDEARGRIARECTSNDDDDDDLRITYLVYAHEKLCIYAARALRMCVACKTLFLVCGSGCALGPRGPCVNGVFAPAMASASVEVALLYAACYTLCCCCCRCYKTTTTNHPILRCVCAPHRADDDDGDAPPMPTPVVSLNQSRFPRDLKLN